MEVDESYFGGLEKNKHAKKKLNAGKGPVGKAAVVAVKDRKTKRVKARVVERTNKATLQPFVESSREQGATVYTDEARAYDGLENRESVKHSVGQYVDGMAHTNGVESFWALLKRARLPRHVSSCQCEALVALRVRVCGPSQHQGLGHDRPDVACRGWHGW